MFDLIRFVETNSSNIKGGVGWGEYSATFTIWCFSDASNKGSLFIAVSVYTSPYHAFLGDNKGWLEAYSWPFTEALL